MSKEPKIEIEDLPKEEEELRDEDLEKVVGGVSRAGTTGRNVSRSSDPDSGDEIV